MANRSNPRTDAVRILGVIASGDTAQLDRNERQIGTQRALPGRSASLGRFVARDVPRTRRLVRQLDIIQ